MFGISISHTGAFATTVLSAALMAGTIASASPDDSNPIQLLDNGADNTLEILSQTPAPTDGGQHRGNSISVTIEGDENGGWGQSWGAALFDDSFAAPGMLQQVGWNNAMSLEVQGQNNLFSMSQTGSNNIATGRISGYNNMAAVVQQGYGNTAAFSQTGRGNSLAISQSSW